MWKLKVSSGFRTSVALEPTAGAQTDIWVKISTKRAGVKNGWKVGVSLQNGLCDCGMLCAHFLKSKKGKSKRNWPTHKTSIIKIDYKPGQSTIQSNSTYTVPSQYDKVIKVYCTHLVCNIVHHNDAVCASVITGCDRTKPLLSRCVPLSSRKQNTLWVRRSHGMHPQHRGGIIISARICTLCAQRCSTRSKLDKKVRLSATLHEIVWRCASQFTECGWIRADIFLLRGESRIPRYLRSEVWWSFHRVLWFVFWSPHQ